MGFWLNGGVKILECKPSDDEIRTLKQRYGEPIIRKLDRKDVSHINLPANSGYLNCIGEGVGLILDENNQYLLVKKANKESWYFPSGRIMNGESIEFGTVREVHEETGLDVKLDSLSSIQIIDFHFANCILRLWHFNFVIIEYSGILGTHDKREIGDCRFFSEPPVANVEYEKYWIKTTLADVPMNPNGEVPRL